MQQLLGQSYHKLKLLSYLYPGDLGKMEQKHHSFDGMQEMTWKFLICSAIQTLIGRLRVRVGAQAEFLKLIEKIKHFPSILIIFHSISLCTYIICLSFILESWWRNTIKPVREKWRESSWCVWLSAQWGQKELPGFTFPPNVYSTLQPDSAQRDLAEVE